MELKLEVVVIPVSDVDRAKAFYTRMAFREDIDFAAGDAYRVDCGELETASILEALPRLA